MRKIELRDTHPDEGSGAVVHDGLVVILLAVSHGPPVGGELGLVLGGDVVPLDLDVLVPV